MAPLEQSDQSEQPGQPWEPGGASDGATQAAIEAHYDVGREFYRLWLDPAMVYSCALWPAALDDDLDRAQQAKLAWHADAAGIGPGARALDVGCGWGAMARFLLEDRQAGHVTGLTLSSDQADEATSLLGVDAPADIRLEDWRDHVPVAPYDAIVSVGAFEHFTHQGLDAAARRATYRRFFDQLRPLAGPRGPPVVADHRLRGFRREQRFGVVVLHRRDLP